MGLGKINELRKTKKMTVDRLSELSGVPKSTLTKIIIGETKNPRIETLEALAKALDCTIFDFSDHPIDSSEENLSRYWTMTAPEAFMVNLYRGLDTHGMKNVDFILNSEYERCCKEKSKLPKAVAQPPNTEAVVQNAETSDYNDKQEFIQIPMEEYKELLDLKEENKALISLQAKTQRYYEDNVTQYVARDGNVKNIEEAARLFDGTVDDDTDPRGK